ncbi:Thiolase, N-terminal domain-containing protein [Radiomyces spectabilis]|uniref:Thiolase, N-terminal domain-containing protein n=1 Tax=Radiomyces spectabilis TaxID=64574 RepID=UPI00221FE892|nr:Thiolase, N-terminal domain-containing protein [Radiomyces spectabilis]KAI8364360.1 Thiolase, N-terminal domain-containing protein [Radiomyces spectabilis]
MFIRQAVRPTRVIFTRSFASSTKGLNDVVIASAVRTPVACFNGGLKSLSATRLGAIAAKAAIERAGLKPEQIEEAYIGNVIQANLGQAPARQVILEAGCPESTEATTINKVCASGMKSVMLAAQSLALGDRQIMLAGGMESMSNAPFYAQRNIVYGHQQMLDAIIKDGLWDVYNQIHMVRKIRLLYLGSCAENTAAKYKISRQDQDEHAIESYKRAAKAWENGVFDAEIVPVTIKGKKGDTVVKVDEEFTNVKYEKIPSLRPVFKKDGTVTAANASTLNDGASALVLMTRQKAEELGVKPLARVVSYADAACAPIDFTIAPSKALPIALEKAGLSVNDISKFELNEAFSVVAKVNEQLMGLDPSKVNVAGGAVALGHPIGSSGSRIIVTLTHLLKSGEFGAAAVCNGGGAASSIIIQRE